MRASRTRGGSGRTHEFAPAAPMIVRTGRLPGALLGVGLSLAVGGLASNPLVLCFKVVNLLTAPISVPFFLALLVPRANPCAAAAERLDRARRPTRTPAARTHHRQSGPPAAPGRGFRRPPLRPPGAARGR